MDKLEPAHPYAIPTGVQPPPNLLSMWTDGGDVRDDEVLDSRVDNRRRKGKLLYWSVGRVRRHSEETSWDPCDGGKIWGKHPGLISDFHGLIPQPVLKPYWVCNTATKVVPCPLYRRVTKYVYILEITDFSAQPKNESG